MRKYFVRLYKNAAITIEYTSLFFSNEVESGNYVASFTFPAIGANAYNLTEHHTEHAATTMAAFDNTAEVFKDTWLLDKGHFEFSELTEGEMSVNLFLGIDALPVMKKKLSELDLGGVRTIGVDAQDVIDHAKDQNTQEYPDVDYVFPPIYNPSFYPVEKNPYWMKIINRWDPVNQKFFTNGFVSAHVENRDTLIPYAFIKYIFKQIFAETPYALAGDFMDDVETDQMLLENNYALDETGNAAGKIYVAATPGTISPSGIITIISPFPFPNETAPYYDPNNQFNGNKWKIPVAGTTEILLNFHFNYTQTEGDSPSNYIEINLLQDDGVSPNILQQVVLTNITGDQPIGFALTAEFLPGEVGNDIYLNINWSQTDIGEIEIIDATLKCTPPTFGNVNEYKKEINLINHVPAITVGEFLVRMFESYAFAPYYRQTTNTVELNYKSTRTTDSAIDYTKQAGVKYQKMVEKSRFRLPEYDFPTDDVPSATAKILYDVLNIDKVATYYDLPVASAAAIRTLVLQTHEIYESYYDIDSTSFKNRVVGYPFIHDPDADLSFEELLLRATPLMMCQTEFSDSNIYPTLFMDQEGTSVAYEMAPQNNDQIRICFWRGMQEYNGHDIPFANNSDYDILGVQTYGLSLDLKGVFGIYRHCWGDWVTYLNRGMRWLRKFTFSLTDFLNFNVYRALRVRQNYFIPIKVTASIQSSIDEIEMEMEMLQIVRVDPIWGKELILDGDFPDPSVNWGTSGDPGYIITFGTRGVSKNIGFVCSVNQFFWPYTKSPFGEYKFELTISGMTTGEVYASIGSVNSSHFTSNGIKKEVLLQNDAVGFIVIYMSEDFDGVLELSSLKPRTG